MARTITYQEIVDVEELIKSGKIYDFQIQEVLEIISNCEDIQESNESRYTKEQAKISAYEDIKEALREVKHDKA